MNHWIKYKDNPVFGSKELGTCFDVQVLRICGKYRMYFSWRPKDALAYSDSSDGIHWNDPTIILLPNPQEQRINRQCVLPYGEKWLMWFTAQNNNESRIALAESDDGEHFTRISGDYVLVPEEAWEKKSVMNPFVLFDEQRKVFRMWYAGGETYEPNALGYAESKDGVHWTKHQNNPIFQHGTEYYDCDRVGGCELKRLPDGRYIMFYIGYENIDLARICAAVSPDGIHDWKRIPENPIVVPSPNGFDAEACYKPTLLFDEKNNRWMLWYNGRKHHDEYIGLVTKDGFELTELK